MQKLPLAFVIAVAVIGDVALAQERTANVVTTAGEVAIFSDRSLSVRTLRTFAAGSNVLLLGCDEEVCQIQFGLIGRIGWVSRTSLLFVNAFEPPQLPPTPPFVPVPYPNVPSGGSEEDVQNIPPPSDPGSSGGSGPPIGISEAPSPGPVAP